MTSESKPSATLGRDEIAEILPHRGDFALPDCVEVYPEENRATGYMRVPERFEEDHFGMLPGVMMVELAYQVAAILVAQTHPNLRGVAGGIKDVQFTTRVNVGDIFKVDVSVEGELDPKRGGKITVHATGCKVGNEDTQILMELTGNAISERLFARMMNGKKIDGETNPLDGLPDAVREHMPE